MYNLNGINMNREQKQKYLLAHYYEALSTIKCIRKQSKVLSIAIENIFVF